MTGHPAADVVTERATVVLQERAVVPLSRWLADAVAEAAGAEPNPRQVQVVTPATSRLTVPLETVLLAAGGRWVVRAPGGGFFDGLRGEPLAWSGSAFTPTGPVPAPEFVADRRPVTGGAVRVQLTVLHGASDALELGAATETCVAALTGSPPTGWGVAEPASERWSRRGVTDHCRGRSPAPSVLVLVGGAPETPALGVLTVLRRPAGVVERLDLSVAGPDVPDYAGLDRLAERLADLPAPLVRSLLISLVPGRPDGTVEPRYTGTPVPYGLLVGPEGVAERGAGHARAAPAPHVLVCGPADRPAVWCRLVGGPDPGAALAAVTGHFGMDR